MPWRKNADASRSRAFHRNGNSAPFAAGIVRCILHCFFAITLIAGCNTKSSESTSHGGASSSEQRTSAESLIQRAQVLLHQGQNQAAIALARDVLIRDPENIRALQTIASGHAAEQDFQSAADMAATIAQRNGSRGVEDWLAAFDWHLRAGNVVACERDLKEAIAIAPADPRTHRTMAQLLDAEGRRFESREYILNLIRLQAAEPRELLSLVELGSPFLLVSLDGVAKESPDSWLQLGKARSLLIADVRPKQARELVEKLKADRPSPAVDAFLGRLYAELGDAEAFNDWLESVEPGTDLHPEYWSAIGSRLAAIGDDRGAIRAFSEAVNRDPTDRTSLRAMALSLDRIGEREKAKSVRENLAVLDKVFRLATNATIEQAMWIAEQLQNLSRPWESLAWFEYAYRMQGGDPTRSPQLLQRRQQIADWESGGSQTAIAKSRLTKTIRFDSESFPLPELKIVGGIQQRTHAPNPDRKPLQFSNAARQVGIDCTFVSEYPIDRVDFYLYQGNGAGLATFDYDLDGRCDLYVVQTGGDPQVNASSNANDFFRQLPDGNVLEIALAAGLDDRGYGQGACVGDLNQDGFPDLLIANIGRNSVYLNQGDGTFRIQDSEYESGDYRWTSSLALADIDGDHLPDVVEVNYLDDPTIYERKCLGQSLECTPQRFRAATDRIFANRGDGSLAISQPASELFETLPNYGFGVVVTRFGNSTGNDVFISNDGDLNHFWKQRELKSGQNGSSFRLVESAGIAGCSIGVSGQSQACMGIASQDFDRNGWIDLAVTNFYNEPLNLFLQNDAGFFVDEAARFGLADSSMNMLGFGIQSADFDNDGWSDLAVLNGHIYDARYAEIPFQMPAQLYRGGADGFTVEDVEPLEEYWRRPQLGRTLAMCDWNRDGRIDLAATHLDQPVALLRNDSVSQNWLQLELVGRVSERDAIGARVEVQAGDQRWTGWQIAGDGYMCTNEPIIHFGLGDTKRIDRLTIEWPSGSKQVVENIAVNARHLMIEEVEMPVQR